MNLLLMVVVVVLAVLLLVEREKRKGLAANLCEMVEIGDKMHKTIENFKRELLPSEVNEGTGDLPSEDDFAFVGNIQMDDDLRGCLEYVSSYNGEGFWTRSMKRDSMAILLIGHKGERRYILTKDYIISPEIKRREEDGEPTQVKTW